MSDHNLNPNGQHIDFGGYNNNNTSKNVDNDGDEVVRLDEQQPLNDPDCKHQFVKDDDELGEAQAWVCIKCRRGVFLPKGVSIT